MTMAIDRFAFYAKNYLDIGHLVQLDEEVRDTYPSGLLGTLHKAFADAFHADTFAGLSGWECVDEEDAPDDGFSFWNRSHYDSVGDRGAFFSIDELSCAAERVQSIERSVLAPLVTCYLSHSEKKGPGPFTGKKLRDAARRSALKLKKAGFKEIEIEGMPEAKGLYVETEIGDLLHISTLGNKERNFKELIKRVEKLARACIPLIERASQK
jgi:hypothetical protein